jgi:hypothetical protein
MRLFLLLALLAISPVVHPTPQVRPSPGPTAHALTESQIYSRQALRRARLLIQMRMLQLRDEQLECVREAILRRLPPDLHPSVSPTTEPAHCRAMPALEGRSTP